MQCKIFDGKQTDFPERPPLAAFIRAGTTVTFAENGKLPRYLLLEHSSSLPNRLNVPEGTVIIAQDGDISGLTYGLNATIIALNGSVDRGTKPHKNGLMPASYICARHEVIPPARTNIEDRNIFIGSDAVQDMLDNRKQHTDRIFGNRKDLTHYEERIGALNTIHKILTENFGLDLYYPIEVAICELLQIEGRIADKKDILGNISMVGKSSGVSPRHRSAVELALKAIVQHFPELQDTDISVRTSQMMGRGNYQMTFDTLPLPVTVELLRDNIHALGNPKTRPIDLSLIERTIIENFDLQYSQQAGLQM